MSTYNQKLRHILPAFLLVTAGTVVAYSFLHWLLGIRSAFLPLKEDRWNFWLPLGVPLGPLCFWLRPRLRVLVFRKNSRTGRQWVLVYVYLFSSALLMLSQVVLMKVAEKHVYMNSIEEYDLYDEAQRYTLDTFYVARYFGGAHTAFSTGGRWGQNFNIDVYVAFPLLKDTTETADEDARFWYGLQFHKQISSALSDEEKDSAYRAFYDACMASLDTMNLYSAAHFARKPFSDDDRHLRRAIEARTERPARDCVVLMPVWEPFTQSLGQTPYWLGGLWIAGNVLFLLILRGPDYRRPEESLATDDALVAPEEENKGETSRPGGIKFSLTLALILVNILVWAVMFLFGVHPVNADAEMLKQWGALEGTDVINGAWWQLFTAQFVHANIMHLVTNMFALLIIGSYVEILFPVWAYAVLYITSGVAGWLAGVWWAPDIVRLGASGAIFGLSGALMALVLANVFPKESKKSLLITFGLYVGINLLAGLGTPDTDNLAHAGGLLSGAVFGILLYKVTGKSAAFQKTVEEEV